MHEFLAVVTHPRVHVPPTQLDVAVRTIDDLARLEGVIMLGETADHWQRLRRLFWTTDRDFSWFPELQPRNPLV